MLPCFDAWSWAKAYQTRSRASGYESADLGSAAVPGGQVTVHYVGVDFETGEQFDASWDRGESIDFPLNGLIAGWQEGIPGMKVGGRRQLVCPPHMAYGDSGGHRLSGRTLVFVIDLLDAR